MASIQLLRDGLFRACEAFQNGALGRISYALVLSRIGDTIVSMLGSELMVGEFGRSGAAISGAAASAGFRATAAARPRIVTRGCDPENGTRPQPTPA